MIIWADSGRSGELIDIWQQSFGDSEEYIRMFLDANSSRIKIPAYELQGKLISVAYLLPVAYCDGKGLKSSCYYLYAAATLPQYRGKGYFAELLRYVQDNLSEPVILVPGEESLAEYYAKQNFYIWQNKHFYENTKSDFTEENLVLAADVSDISVKEYYKKREEILTSQPHMEWSLEFLEYIVRENMFCGGNQICMKIRDKEYIMMYRTIDEGVLDVQEILPHKNLQEAIQQLSGYFLCKEIRVHLKPLVMATQKLAYNDEAYFNLTMG